MFSLSVSRNALFATLIFTTVANAEIVSVEGTYLFPKTMSEAACYQKALMQAKQKAIREVVGERLTNELVEVCDETEDTILDLIGYLILYKVQVKKEENKIKDILIEGKNQKLKEFK